MAIETREVKPLVKRGIKDFCKRHRLLSIAGIVVIGILVAGAATIMTMTILPDQPGKPGTPEPGPAKRVRYLVFGDADFLGNNIFTRLPGNRLLLVNAARWAMDIEEQISIPPREEVYKPLQLTEVDLNLILLVSVVLLPLVIIALGIAVYLRRRLHG